MGAFLTPSFYPHVGEAQKSACAFDRARPARGEFGVDRLTGNRFFIYTAVRSLFGSCPQFPLALFAQLKGGLCSFPLFRRWLAY